MKKGNVNADLFSPTESNPKANKKSVGTASTQAVQASGASIELSGERRTFSTYLDTAITPHLNAARAQLLMMGIGQSIANKTDVVEAALVMLLEDFQTNGDNSYLAAYMRSRS